MRTQGGDGHLHAQERPREGPALPHLDLGPPASRTSRVNVCCSGRVCGALRWMPELTDAEAAWVGLPGNSGREVVQTHLTDRMMTLRSGLLGQKADHHDLVTS